MWSDAWKLTQRFHCVSVKFLYQQIVIRGCAWSKKWEGDKHLVQFYNWKLMFGVKYVAVDIQT